MSRKTPKPVYSIAMSVETGCIVMTRSNGERVTVIGSIPRAESLHFAAELTNWRPAGAPAAEAARPTYNH